MDAGDPASRAAQAYAAMGDGNLDGAVAHFSAAVREFSVAGDTRQAALACVGLGKIFANFMVNRVAARAWFTRALRLIEDEEPCVEQGWVALAAIGCDVDDPAVLLRRAELALARARQFGDINLETKALADGGLAHVQAGRVAEGMAMMDEAMALACGTADDLEAAAMSACSFFTACYYTADFARVEEWGPMMRRRGLIAAQAGPSAIISSHCDSVQGTLLCHLGRWHEAERVLMHAFEGIERVMPGSAWHPPIALADLRIMQGRLAEAEALLLGRDGHMQALLPTARLHMARHDHALACATASRGLRLMGQDRVRAAALLGVLVQAELGRGDVTRAAEFSAELDASTEGLGLAVLSGEAARLRARVQAARGELTRAIASVQEAQDQLGNAALPWLRVTLHLDLARWHEAAGERAAAAVEGCAAAALLARLDVTLPAEDSAMLFRLGVDVAPRPVNSGCRVAVLERDGASWAVEYGQMMVRLRDSKGLRYLAELVAHPGSERHAIDLVDVVEGVPSAGTGLNRRRLGDAGQLLDGPARAAYRRRVEELRNEVEDALAVEDDRRAADVQTELDALVAELARAFGLGGLDRRASSVAEKARLNVTRALRAAIAKAAEPLPEAGAVLGRRVRTGLFCAYEPRPEDGVVWTVQVQLNGPRPN